MHIAINAIPISPGGGLTVIAGVAQGLRAARPNCRITVLCRVPETVKHFQGLSAVDEVKTVLGNSGEFGTFVTQQVRINRFLADVKPDIVLTVNHFLSNCKYPQVVYHLNQRRFSNLYRCSKISERIKEGMRDWASRKALRNASINAFESQFLLDAAIESSNGVVPVNSNVVYIGLPETLTSSALTCEDEYDGRPQLVSVTSDNPHKDTPTLVRVVKSLHEMRPEVPWRLIVSGFTPQKRWQPFKDLAAELGVSDAITWLSARPTEELDQIMRKSLCMVNTSVMESFAMVPVEAMARRCPPVVADCASMPESIADAGLLAQPHDAGSFARQIIQIYDSPDLRSTLVERGVKHSSKLTWTDCGESFATLIEQTVGESTVRYRQIRRAA